MQKFGYESQTIVTDTWSINSPEDWDCVLSERYTIVPKQLRIYVAFALSIQRYDIFLMSFNGFLGYRFGSRFEPAVLKLAGKKTVILPYGADAKVYGKVRSPVVAHGLMMSYPSLSREQGRIDRRVSAWCRKADAVLPGSAAFDGLGRWDVLQPSTLTLNVDAWKRQTPINMQDGRGGPVVVVHAPNHRGFKGTEFIVAAVEHLQQEGLQIDFRLIEGVPNSEIHHVFTEEADILIDQLLFPGHGLNALEGLAAGLVVLSNLSDDAALDPMRWYTYFDECPIVSASPADVTEVLRELVLRPHLREQLSEAGRGYVEKYHGDDSAAYLFSHVIEYVNGNKTALKDLYHPLLGDYPNRSPKIVTPLYRNRIPQALGTVRHNEHGFDSAATEKFYGDASMS